MFFSLIIPVYNTSPWLNECLDSISSQTFSDWECICVDDGSTDDSLLILQKYQSKDSRFRVFHKTNGGVSSARNYGLEKVTGKYFSFVDSDDIISKYTLENWHFYIEKTNADVLIEALSPFSFANASDIPSVLPVSKKNMYRLFKDSREALDYFNLLLFERNLCMLAQKVYRARF